MKKFKLILKGVLLYVTAFATMLFISGVDSIMDNGYFTQWLFACIILYYACYKLISEEEMEKITLYKQLNKLMGEENEDR